MSAPHDDTARPIRITQGVARGAGFDLAVAVLDGALDPASYSAMILRCRSCPWAANCLDWPDQPRSGRGLWPKGCPNAPQYAALLARKRH